jgi:hypothetical protein
MFLHQNRLLHKALLYAKTVLYAKNMFYTKITKTHKNNVLAGPVQALIAACRIGLSMVPGGTRRRRLNKYIYSIK